MSNKTIKRQYGFNNEDLRLGYSALWYWEEISGKEGRGQMIVHALCFFLTCWYVQKLEQIRTGLYISLISLVICHPE